MQMNQKVKMIFCPVDPIKITSLLFKNTPDVFVQFFPMRFLQTLSSILCTKNDVIVNLKVGSHSITVWLIEK